MSYIPNDYSNDAPSDFEQSSTQPLPSTFLDSILDFSYRDGTDGNSDSFLNVNENHNFSYLPQNSNRAPYSVNIDFTPALLPQLGHPFQQPLAPDTLGSSSREDGRSGEGLRSPGGESTRSRKSRRCLARSATSPYMDSLNHRRARDRPAYEPTVNSLHRNSQRLSDSNHTIGVTNESVTTSPGERSGSRPMASLHHISKGEGRSEINFASTSNVPQSGDIVRERRRQLNIVKSQKYRDQETEDIEELRESLLVSLRRGTGSVVFRNAIGQLRFLEDLKQKVGNFERELEEKDATIKQNEETIARYEAIIARYEEIIGVFQ